MLNKEMSLIHARRLSCCTWFTKGIKQKRP